MAGYIFDDVAGTSLTENDAAAARVNANRALVSTIEDGATRARYATVTASNALKVDGSAVTQPVSGTVSITSNSAVNVAQVAGTNTVTAGVSGLIAVGGNVANAVAATSNPVPVGGIFTTTPATLTTGQTATLQFTAAQNAKCELTTVQGTAIDVNSGNKSAGTVRVVLATDQPALTNKLLVTPDSVALPANQSCNTAQFGGTNVSTGTGAGGAGIPRVTVSNDSTLGLVPVTSGGCSINHLISAATTNATNVKASAGQVYGWTIFNTNAAIRYVKLHNTAGAPTAGTGVVYTIGVPATGGNNITLPTGLAFSTGIAFTTVTGVADADTVAVGASDLAIDIHFK
jgi:hypothetical protein